MNRLLAADIAGFGKAHELASYGLAGEGCFACVIPWALPAPRSTELRCLDRASAGLTPVAALSSKVGGPGAGCRSWGRTPCG
jgi:hypothetical protein